MALKLITAVMVIFVFVMELRNKYFYHFFKYMMSVKWNQYVRFIAFAAIIIGIAFLIDAPLLQWLQAIQNPFFDFLVDFGRWTSRNIVFILMALYVLAYAIKKKMWNQFIFGTLFSSLMTGLVSHLLKFVFLRARPYGNLGPFSFFHLGGLTHNKHMFQSFPSGDVAIMAGAAAYLFYAIKNPYLKILTLMIPISTALSRVDYNKHWPSDGLFAIAISLVLGHLIFNFHKNYLLNQTQDLPFGSK